MPTHPEHIFIIFTHTRNFTLTIVRSPEEKKIQNKISSLSGIFQIPSKQEHSKCPARPVGGAIGRVMGSPKIARSHANMNDVTKFYGDPTNIFRNMPLWTWLWKVPGKKKASTSDYNQWDRRKA